MGNLFTPNISAANDSCAAAVYLLLCSCWPCCQYSNKDFTAYWAKKSAAIKKKTGKVKPKKIDLGNSAPFLPIFPTLTKQEKSFNSAGLFNGPL
jgi:hypothetical protein